jgi:hypothetical protein
MGGNQLIRPAYVFLDDLFSTFLLRPQDISVVMFDSERKNGRISSRWEVDKREAQKGFPLQ